VSHPALHYEGNWRVTPDAADPGKTGDTLSFDFYGTDLALRIQGGPYWALYRVWVDGGPVNALPRDESGAPYLVLHDPLAEIRTIPVATGLPQGKHRVRMEATGGWGQWALQGVSIGDSARAARWPGWLLLGMAVFGTAFWAGLVWSQRRALAAEGVAAGEPSPGTTSCRTAWLDRVALRANVPLWLVAIGLLLMLAASQLLILDLAVIAGLGLLFMVCPDLSLPLIAASIPFWSRPEHILRWEFSLFEILVWLAAAALVSRWAIGHLSHVSSRTPNRSGTGHFTFRVSRFTRYVRGLDWPVLALLVLGLVSTLTAPRAVVALREYRTVFLGGVLFYWPITRVPAPAGGRFSAWPLLNGLLAGAVIVSVVAIGQLVTGQGRVDIEGVWRVRAFYGSPNNLALVLDRVIPLALAIAAFGGKTGGPAAGAMLGGKTLRWIYGLAALVMTVACAATFSKGALLLALPVGVGLVLLVGAWRARQRWPLGLFAGLLILGAAGLTLLARTPRFADLWNFTTGTSLHRLRLWQGAWRMALDHPWLGVGPDNFLYAYRTRYVLPSAWQELNLSHPHNIVLDLWTRLGIAGLAVGIWAVAAAVRRSLALLKHADPWVWPIALGLLGGLAATVAHGLIDNSLFLVDLMALFMLSLGLLQRLTHEN
jgi:O-antigen ligase